MNLQTKVSYTPGPWKVEDDTHIVQAYGAECSIADIRFDNCDTDVQLLADARLIAKAPEMAELLRRFVIYNENSPVYAKAMEEAQRVLREAGVEV